MKKTLAFLSVLAVLSLSAFVAKKDDTYKVDVTKSSIEWIGRKVTGQHTGTVKLSAGNLIYNGSSLKGGSFTMDMTSILTTDGSGERLEGHLKAEDFFGVEKNPTSTFTVTKVAPAAGDQVTITGNLTIKGITNPVTFPATVKKSGNAIAAVAKGVKVDRTKYGIKYNSKSIFSSIGDKAIDDEFELSINLVATK